MIIFTSTFFDFLQNPLNIVFFGFYLRGMIIDTLGTEWAATATTLGIIIQAIILVSLFSLGRWFIRKLKGVK